MFRAFFSGLLCLFGFFFKQRPAYDMRISDWSSDVCSSDRQRRSSTWDAPFASSAWPGEWRFTSISRSTAGRASPNRVSTPQNVANRLGSRRQASASQAYSAGPTSASQKEDRLSSRTAYRLSCPPAGLSASGIDTVMSHQVATAEEHRYPGRTGDQGSVILDAAGGRMDM